MAEYAADKAENFHTNLNVFDLSLVNNFDSEDPGTTSSFSIPSEPPDLGNWFSSYVYESPALSTEEELNSVVSGGTDSEKVGVIFEEIGKNKEDNLMELRNDLDKDALVFGEKVSSCSGNLSLNKSENNLFITKKGGNESIYGKVVEDHDLVPFKDDTTPCLRNVDSPQDLEKKFSSLSDLSEPPDIRNWFSSYAYESPAPDSLEELNGSVSGEIESEKAGFISEVCVSTKENDLREFGNHADKDASVFTGGASKQQNLSVNKGKSNLYITKIGENVKLGGNQVKDRDLLPFEYDATPFLHSADSPQNLEATFSPEVEYTLSKRKKSSNMNHEKYQLNLLERKDRRENHIEGIDSPRMVDHEDSRKCNGVSPKKLLPCSNNEEEGRNVTMNGFVSTKKNNCTNKIGGNYLKSSSENQIIDKMQTRAVRKPLSERTNVFVNEVVAPEVTGKWKCPQKSKPDLGPPMKQQRLEWWIHRV